ncbi:MAG: ornithine carbamoyltransferase [Gammaproteobacteria bacterium]
MTLRHFLSLRDFSGDEISAIVERAIELKALRANGERPPLFERKVLAMIFEKSSTRTRVSFEAAMAEGGGRAIFLSTKETQLGRGEPPEDTARVLSEMADAIMIRTFAHDVVERMADSASIPVINGLTNELHPCQLLADLMTFREHRGAIKGAKVAWIGDGNNMCNSYINAAALMGFDLHIACPEGYEPKLAAGSNVHVGHDPVVATKAANLVVTDVWASMETETEQRRQVFGAYQVNQELMRHAESDAIFMHCLPAHRGEEVSGEVIEGAQSVVWDEAGNRLHAQKALLEFLLA